MGRINENFKVGTDCVFPSTLESGDNGEAFRGLVS